MSNQIYPIGLVSKMKITPGNRVIADTFDDGSTAARLMWPAYTFKRKVEATHATLTDIEFGAIRGLYRLMSGSYDSFWFRDNVTRSGNILCRFTQPTSYVRDGMGYTVTVSLEEVAAILAFPEASDVQTAAGGVYPDIWLDANRQTYYLVNGQPALVTQLWDSAAGLAVAGKSPILANAGNLLYPAQQYNSMLFGYRWTLQTQETIAAGTAKTVFAICSQPSTSTKQVLMMVGGMGTGHGLGICLNASNQYEPFLGGSEVWTGAQSLNSPASTYRSVAVTADASNNVTLYINGASAGTVTTNPFSPQSGPITVGKATDGSLAVPSPGSELTHVLVFPGALTSGQVAAVHALFGYQFGI
jgi:hypothetical protein